jgi:molybdopterin-binding protein
VASSITRQSAEDLGLAPGSKVVVLIKSTEVGLVVED